MKKKIRVDFVSHASIVVELEDCDDIYDKAARIAEEYINGNPICRPTFEVEDDGVDDADESDEVDVYSNC